jgi:phage terminase large subunit-like protein
MPLLQTADNRSLIDRWRDDGTLASRIEALTPEQAREFLTLWEVWSRPNQRIPRGMGEAFRVWIFRAGRGSGKTRSGSETCRRMTEHVGRIALVAPTAADVRDVIVEGESGIMSVFPDDERPNYEPSKRRVTFKNGAVAFTYSAEEPERLRGPQHGWAWIDEPASMPSGQAMLDNLLLGLRLGSAPWAMVTGTPKPLKWLRELSDRTDTVTTTGTTFDNERYLARGFIIDVLGRYEGTRLGRQELFAEWLEDVEGALWTQAMIDDSRMASFDLARPWESLNAWLTAAGLAPRQDRRLWRIVVAVDPPGETAECGIVVAAAPTQGQAGVDHVVILEDASIAGRPEVWGSQVASVARKWGAERVVVESNQGGDMTRATIAAVDPSLRIEKIHAKIGKAARAEPVSALYERRLIHHAGFLPMLEQQMTTWVSGDKSPDRLDALVHAVSTLVTAQAKVQASVRSVANRRLPA